MPGWIKLHRQIIDNKLWFCERFTKAQAWLDLLLLANHNHKPSTFFVRGNEVILKRGQLGYAITTLARRWKWNERTVDKFLSMLQKDGMIHYRKSSITTVITIKNYGLYQDNTGQNTKQSKNRIQTNKNDKNEIIELAKILIKSISKQSSLYSIIGKYKNILGEEKLKNILTDCIERGNEFPTQQQLAAYLETCTKTNGKSHHSFNPIEVNL